MKKQEKKKNQTPVRQWWMGKEDVEYIYNWILLIHDKKNEILPLVTTQIDLQAIMLSELSPRKTKYHDFPYMQNTKENKTKQNKWKQKTEKLSQRTN